MNDTVLVAVVTAIGVAFAAVIGLLVAWVDRRSKRRTADAAVSAATASDKAAEAAHVAADAASEEARAQMRVAIVAEREQASADWARYVDAQDRQIARLHEAQAENARRLTNAELRIEEADQRAHDWEKKYRKAMIYLRGLILWINREHPGDVFPIPPPELELDV